MILERGTRFETEQLQPTPTGRLIRVARRLAKPPLTQAELARRTYSCRACIGHVETGFRDVAADLLTRIVNVLSRGGAPSAIMDELRARIIQNMRGNNNHDSKNTFGRRQDAA